MCCFHAVRPVKPVAKIMLLGDSPSKPRSQVTMWCLVHLSFFLVFGFFPTRLFWVHSCFAGNFFRSKTCSEQTSVHTSDPLEKPQAHQTLPQKLAGSGLVLFWFFMSHRVRLLFQMPDVDTGRIPHQMFSE